MLKVMPDASQADVPEEVVEATEADDERPRARVSG
jgi:hypothetical protein